MAARLAIRPGAIGDTILALPAIEHLGHEVETLEVWVPSASVPLIRFADRVAPIASTGLDLLGLPGVEPPSGLLARLRGFESILSWYGANRDEFREAVRALGLPFRFLEALPPAASGMHAADFFLGQARRAAASWPEESGPEGREAWTAVPGAADSSHLGRAGEAVPRIACPEPAERGFVAIHPFSGSAKKNWPLERFREVAAALSARAPIRWIAEPRHELPGALNIADLYELGCRLRGAALYLGNDSGITHLAAAAGAPVLALFGPTDPALWGPRGRVTVIATPEPGQPIEQIGAARVLQAAERLLAAPRCVVSS